MPAEIFEVWREARYVRAMSADIVGFPIDQQDR